jgi:hypothetical protein
VAAPVTGTKLSALTAILAAALASTDLLEILDVSDTTMAATGTNKKITVAEFVTYLNTAIAAASETVSGRVELATAAETLTGTDNTRAVHRRVSSRLPTADRCSASCSTPPRRRAPPPTGCGINNATPASATANLRQLHQSLGRRPQDPPPRRDGR